MSTHNFMLNNLTAINEVIDGLPATFMSHDFIQKFTQLYQHEYIMLLYLQSTNSPQNPTPFKEIHSQMARFLAVKQSSLGIEQQGKDGSMNIFGVSSPNEKWKKVE